MSRLQTPYLLLLLISSAALSPVARGEQPTAKAISAYSAECKQTGEAMDLIARFGTDYSGLDLAGVDFRGAHTVGLDTNLQGAEFGGPILDGADFTGANLAKASFVTASLRQTIFREATLAGTHFQECDLSGAQLQKIKLSDATWARYEFPGADLTGADLSGMSLAGANFKSATLRSADLSRCDLEQADFMGADLTGADFSGTNVRHAIFQGARGLEEKELARLTAQAGRWKFDLENWTTAFMDSPLFVLCLLIVVPLGAVGLHFLVRRRRSAAATATKSRFQFSLARLLAIVLVVALFLGIARWSTTGVYSLVMVCALTMMAAEICYARNGRAWPAIVLVVALGYATANIAVLFSALYGDNPFSIFNPGFMGAAVLLGPLLIVAAVASSVFLPRATRANPPWTGLAGLTIWMIGVGAANLYIIAAAAASV